MSKMLSRTSVLLEKSVSKSILQRQWAVPLSKSNRYFAHAACSSEDDVVDCCDCCFHKFGVEEKFAVPSEELKSTYKRLMSELHPDRHASKPTEEQDVLNQKASRVTRCYDVVSNPQSRALYLLELMGRPMDEKDTGALVGAALLMEVMEIREEIDNTSSDKDLQQMYTENKNRMEQLYVKLADAFETNDLDEARRLTAVLQYWNRVEETIREKISMLE